MRSISSHGGDLENDRSRLLDSTSFVAVSENTPTSFFLTTDPGLSQQTLVDLTQNSRERQKYQRSPPSSSSVSDPHTEETTHDPSSSHPQPICLQDVARDDSPRDLPHDETRQAADSHALNSPWSAPTSPSSSFVRLTLGTSCPGSAASTPSSRRNSLITSRSEIQADELLKSNRHEEIPGQRDYHSSQLIMPMITIPSRRPFTDEGRTIGSLNIMVLGQTGVGKSSMIKAIVQSCSHIVHIDPISTSSGNGSSPHAKFYASTVPYPSWRSDHRLGLSSSRRGSEEAVLDRNVCFIEPSGLSGDAMSDNMSGISGIIASLEAQFRSVPVALRDSDALNLLTGNGGSIVNIILYLVSPDGVLPQDIQNMLALQDFTNVVPILCQSDKLPPDEIEATKRAIADRLLADGVRPFNLVSGGQPPESDHSVFAVSCLPVFDDCMDASLLMSSTYMEPLAPSDLTQLVSRIFCQEGAAYLRYSSALKFLEWRKHQYASMQVVSRERFNLQPGLDINYWLDASHDQVFLRRREQNGEVIIADWAENLHRSLAVQRARLTSPVALEDRRLDERHNRGMLTTMTRQRGALERTWARQRRDRRTHQDPLGLLLGLSSVQSASWTVLECVGTLGVVGSLGLLAYGYDLPSWVIF